MNKANLVGWSDQNISTGLQVFQMNLQKWEKQVFIWTKTKAHFRRKERSEGIDETWKKSYPLDEVGLFDQTKSAPKRVVNGGAVSLKLGSEASINDSTAAGFLN